MARDFICSSKVEMKQSSTPLNRSKKMMLMHYKTDKGEETGGWVDIKSKMEGNVYIPASTMVEGKCLLKDVRLPAHFTVIGLKMHNSHVIGEPIGRFEYVEDERVRRGVYVTGYIDKSEHICEDHHNLMGYDLCIEGSSPELHARIHKRKLEQEKEAAQQI